MAAVRGACPHCGATIEFRAGSSVSLVCRYCNSIVARTDREFRAVGRVADVAFSDEGLAPGDRGTFRGRSFTVEGRVVMRHPQGGVWEEYYVVFGNNEPGWIAESQGFWHVVEPIEDSGGGAVAVGADGAPVVSPSSLAPGDRVWIGSRGPFTVDERNVGTIASAEGELPMPIEVDTPRYYVDLSGPDGAYATIDFGDGRAASSVYVGHRGTFADFAIVRREDYRPGHAASMSTITCPSCGAPIDIQVSGSERVGCKYCGAVSDIALREVVARQDKARSIPAITLGKKGTLTVPDAYGVHDVEWTVLAYLERSTGAVGSDDWFGWQEYLLYNATHGYRWLVFDEGKFLLVTPLSAGDVDASRAPVFVRFRDRLYKRRNGQIARVDYVLGEVYWKVQVGESVSVTDYEQGRQVISSEDSGAEINWSHAMVVPTSVIESAFEYTAKPNVYGEAFNSTPSWVTALVVFALFLVLLAMVNDCDDSDSTNSSPSFRGGGGIYFGGFGGK